MNLKWWTIIYETVKIVIWLIQTTYNSQLKRIPHDQPDSTIYLISYS